MVDMPSRRSVLGATGVTVAGAISGCLFDNPEAEGGHLFVENVRSNDFVIGLIVTRGTDREGEEVVSGWYQIPEEQAIQFEGVIEPGTPYTITVYSTTASDNSVTVTIPDCGDNGEGARDVSVRTRENDMSIIPWGCGDEYTKLELEYVDPDELQVESPAGAELQAATATESTETGESTETEGA